MITDVNAKSYGNFYLDRELTKSSDNDPKFAKMKESKPNVHDNKETIEEKIGVKVNAEEEEKVNRAFFDVDENRNVVIKIVDSNGELIKQIPPEEYIKMSETLDESFKNLFHLEA
ncbi:Flagellar protein FlaG protein [Candidatus Magnetoovum chiemensis]|nr:Flagellar protein FlaG protein [Candidatus Magnetoovum chiemensis]